MFASTIGDACCPVDFFFFSALVLTQAQVLPWSWSHLRLYTPSLGSALLSVKVVLTASPVLNLLTKNVLHSYRQPLFPV